MCLDVTALFTSIPVTEAVSVIKDRLNQDTTLKDRCELSVNQIITLLEICLNTTYFIYDGVFYKQKKGAVEGRCKFLGDLSRFESCCVAFTAQNIPGCGHNHQNFALLFHCH